MIEELLNMAKIINKEQIKSCIYFIYFVGGESQGVYIG